MSKLRPFAGGWFGPLVKTALILAGVAISSSACSDESGPDGATTADGGVDARVAGDSKPVDSRPADSSAPPVDQALKPDAPAQTWPDLKDVTLYVNLGDSIAAGYGVKDSYAELLLANDDAAYPDYQGKDLATRFVGVKLHDGAISGSTSSGMVQQLSKVPDNPGGHTIVTVSAGGNDLLFNVQVAFDPAKVQQFAQQIAANLKKVVAHFGDTTRYPGGATIVFFNIYDPTDATGTIPEDVPLVPQCKQYTQALELVAPLLLKHLALYNSELATFAIGQPGIWIADMHTAFLGHGYHYKDPASPFYDSADPTLWFSYDCIHPNQDGHLGLRALLWRLLFER